MEVGIDESNVMLK